MSYLGAIRFVLTTDGCSVSDVSIEPAKELRIEKLLCGRPVKEALELLPPLFALCPDSQTAAAADIPRAPSSINRRPLFFKP